MQLIAQNLKKKRKEKSTQNYKWNKLNVILLQYISSFRVHTKLANKGEFLAAVFCRFPLKTWTSENIHAGCLISRRFHPVTVTDIWAVQPRKNTWKKQHNYFYQSIETQQKCYYNISICFLCGNKEQMRWIKEEDLFSVKGNKDFNVNQALWQLPHWIVQKTENYLSLHLLAEISNQHVSKQTHHSYLHCTCKLPGEIAVKAITPPFLWSLVSLLLCIHEKITWCVYNERAVISWTFWRGLFSRRSI